MRWGRTWIDWIWIDWIWIESNRGGLLGKGKLEGCLERLWVRGVTA